MKIAVTIIILIIIIGGALFLFVRRGEAPTTTLPDTNEPTTMDTLTLTSSAFADGGVIPQKYTCDGDNTNPPLEISNVPEGAKSLALIMDDPDIPEEVKTARGIDVFDHWVIFNLQPTTNNIQEGTTPPGVEGNNGAGELGYTGPCPPPQYEPKEHRYFFRVYALDATLGLSAGATKAEVEEAMQGHILAGTALMGRYERQ